MSWGYQLRNRPPQDSSCRECRERGHDSCGSCIAGYLAERGLTDPDFRLDTGNAYLVSPRRLLQEQSVPMESSVLRVYARDSQEAAEIGMTEYAGMFSDFRSYIGPWEAVVTREATGEVRCYGRTDGLVAER